MNIQLLYRDLGSNNNNFPQYSYNSSLILFSRDHYWCYASDAQTTKRIMDSLALSESKQIYNPLNIDDANDGSFTPTYVYIFIKDRKGTIYIHYVGYLKGI